MFHFSPIGTDEDHESCFHALNARITTTKVQIHLRNVLLTN